VIISIGGTVIFGMSPEAPSQAGALVRSAPLISAAAPSVS